MRSQLDGRLEREADWRSALEVWLSPFAAGPFAIPAARVQFQLGTASPNDVAVQLLLSKGSRWEAATVTVPIGSAHSAVRFIFAAHLPRSIATAAAGTAIASAFGGKWAGAIETVPIAHGVSRPVRPVDLHQPLTLGGMRLLSLLVQPDDGGPTTSIPEPGAQADAQREPTADDLVVVSKRRRRQRDDALVYLGADARRGCSSRLFDKPAEIVTLICAAPPTMPPNTR